MSTQHTGIDVEARHLSGADIGLNLTYQGEDYGTIYMICHTAALITALVQGSKRSAALLHSADEVTLTLAH